MSRAERLYKLRNLLSKRRIVSGEALQASLEVSRATLTRDLQYLRDRLNVPITFDRDAGGYRLDPVELNRSAQYELPGLWFSAEEIHALLTMQYLLANLDPAGLLGPHIDPLLTRLTSLLAVADNPPSDVVRRIRIETVGARSIRLENFQAVGSALLRRRRIFIVYQARGKNETSQRQVSPQRLVYYRDNWYLDAWCHLRQDLRSFSVDSIWEAKIETTSAIDVDETELDRILGSGYGIFSGQDISWATLEFSVERTRWVAQEKWHPSQKGEMLADGRYRLTVPYSQTEELIMDILRHGAHVKVIDPPELREAVRREHLLAASDS